MAALWCLLGVWCAEMEPLPAPSRDILTLSDGLLRTVEGTVVDAAPLRTEQVDIGVKTGIVVAVAGAVSFTHCVKGFCAPNMF